MIPKDDMNRVDQLMEDTFPTGAIPPSPGYGATSPPNFQPSPPQDAKAGAGTTALAAVSKLTGAATAPAALVPSQGAGDRGQGSGLAPAACRLTPADFIQQLGALRHEVRTLEDRVTATLGTIDADPNRRARTVRETELLGDAISNLWRATKDLDQRLFDFVVMNRWNS